MPGPMSDSYDPEWGTSSNAATISEALQEVYDKVSDLVENVKPLFILHLLDQEYPQPITATLTTKEWRIIRFALERAKESL